MKSWVWSQQWKDVLFLHWDVPIESLRPLVPPPLEIDTRDGAAWVSLVLFRLRVRPRWLPFLPWVSELVEVNLRTYVHFEDRPGIWFLSAHADNRWAIRLARLLTPMPYEYAALRYERHGDAFRVQVGCGDPSAFPFLPTGREYVAEEHSLDEWLLERYRLFITGPSDLLLQAEVAHPPWAVRGVEGRVSGDGLGTRVGLDLARPPDRSHFSSGVAARFGGFRPVGSAAGSDLKTSPHSTNLVPAVRS